MERDYTLYETSTLSAETKDSVSKLMAGAQPVGVIIYAINLWTDSIDAIPERQRNNLQLRDWTIKIISAVAEMQRVIDGDAPQG